MRSSHVEPDASHLALIVTEHVNTSHIKLVVGDHVMFVCAYSFFIVRKTDNRCIKHIYRVIETIIRGTIVEHLHDQVIAARFMKAHSCFSNLLLIYQDKAISYMDDGFLLTIFIYILVTLLELIDITLGGLFCFRQPLEFLIFHVVNH